MFTPPLLTFIRNSPYCVYKNTEKPLRGLLVKSIGYLFEVPCFIRFILYVPTILNNGLWSSSAGLYKLHRLCFIRAVGLPTPAGSCIVEVGE